MADSRLDDFFAKKDKNKKSRKFTTTDQIARKLEEGGKKPEKQPTRKDKEKSGVNSLSVGSTLLQHQHKEEDEWREIEEKETDYSGLKIQNLQFSDLRDEEAEKERLEDQNEDDHLGTKDAVGPWNKSSAPAEVVNPNPEPVVKEKEETRGKYVIPQARSSGTSAVSKTRSKAAPEISSELHFPSLSSTFDGGKKGSDSDKGFESVKRGASRVVEDPGSKGPKLELGNKFDALSQTESS